MKIPPQQAKYGLAGDPVAPRTASLLLTAILVITAVLAPAVPAFAANELTGEAAESSARISGAGAAPSATPKKAPQARSKAEFDAYQNAIGEEEPARLEAAAIEFAQRFPASGLRPFLFQRAMGLYQQRDDSAKALEMARAVLKYDPANPVALLAAAQLLADGTRDHNLDRDDRLQEAAADAQLALQHAGELTQPAGVSAEQLESMIAELRGEAHEVLATVAYKRRKYRTAVDEYYAAVAGQKEHTGAVLWLRLAAAHSKLGEYSLAIAATEKALAASEAGDPVREIAEKELVSLKALAAEAATKPSASPAETPTTQMPTPSASPNTTPNANQPIQKTENFRSPVAGE